MKSILNVGTSAAAEMLSSAGYPAAGGAARTFFVRNGAASAFFVRNGERSERPGGFGERNERFFEDFCAGCWFLRAPRRTFFVKTRRAEHFL